MKYKEFFKPTIAKILIFIILMFAFSMLFYPYTPGGRGNVVPIISFPMTNGLEFAETYCIIYEDGTVNPPGCEPRSYFDINYSGLIFNIVFWYLLSNLIVFIYHKVKKK